jgi:hypothetical protein
MDVNVPALSKLDSAQYTGVSKDIKDMVIANPFVYGKVKSYFDVNYLPHCNLLNSALGKKTKSVLTEQIVKSRDKRMAKFKALRHVINGNVKKSDEKIIYAAKELLNTLNAHEDFTYKSVTKQTPIIDDVLIAFDGTHLEYVELLGIKPEVDDLRAENDNFKDLMSKREDENIKKPTVTIVELRKKLDPAIRTLCSMIGVFAISEPSEELDAFIKKLNEMFKKYGAVSTTKKTTASTNTTTDKPSEDKPSDEPTEPATPSEPVVEETHEERMAKARAWITVGEGEWKNGDYCYHNVNSVKTYWKLIDVSKKDVKPYLSGGEVAWEKVG